MLFIKRSILVIKMASGSRHTIAIIVVVIGLIIAGILFYVNNERVPRNIVQGSRSRSGFPKAPDKCNFKGGTGGAGSQCASPTTICTKCVRPMGTGTNRTFVDCTGCTLGMSTDTCTKCSEKGCTCASVKACVAASQSACVGTGSS